MMTGDEKYIIMRDCNEHMETQCIALKAFIVVMGDVNETEKNEKVLKLADSFYMVVGKWHNVNYYHVWMQSHDNGLHFCEEKGPEHS